MLVDGLSVCLPDDPDGNAKLMFSILDCLPKANRVSDRLCFYTLMRSCLVEETNVIPYPTDVLLRRQSIAPHKSRRKRNYLHNAL